MLNSKFFRIVALVIVPILMVAMRGIMPVQLDLH